MFAKKLKNLKKLFSFKKGMMEYQLKPTIKTSESIDTLIKLEKEFGKVRTDILSKIKSKLEKIDNLSEYNARLNARLIDLEERVNGLIMSKKEPKRIENLSKLSSEISKKGIKNLEDYLGVMEMFSDSEIEMETSSKFEKLSNLKNISKSGLSRKRKRQLNKLDKIFPEELSKFTSQSEGKILSELIDERRIELLNETGIELLEKGEYEKACECFENIIEINPNIREAWVNKGISLENLGKFDEEISCYNTALEKDENYAIAWYNLGIAWNNKGEDVNAWGCFVKAHEIDPSLPTFL